MNDASSSRSRRFIGAVAARRLHPAADPPRLGFLPPVNANPAGRVPIRWPSRVIPGGVPVLIRTRSVHDHASDALALVHQLEPLVDVRQRHGVRDHRIDLDLALHVPVDDFRHVGAAARAAEGRALPDAAGDQLKWAGCDLRAGRRDADDDGLAPAAMAGFERLAHHRDVARAVEGVVGTTDLVGAALRHVDEVRNQIAADLLRIDEVGHAEALAPLLLGVVDIDADDHVRAGEPQSLDDIEADAAEPEHDALRAGFHLGGIEDRADA